MEGEQQKRWQFSLRDVLQIILIVALAVGWFVDHGRLMDELVRQQQPKSPPLAVTARPTLTPLPPTTLPSPNGYGIPTVPPPTTSYPRLQSDPAPRLTIPNIVPPEPTATRK